jgi:hypothetical protein
MAGAAANIVTKEITHIVTIFARTRFANMAKLSETRISVFMTGAVIFPEGSFGVRHPFSPVQLLLDRLSERAMGEVSVSLSHTLVIKGLTAKYRRVKGVCCPARPQCGNGLAAIRFMRFAACRGGWRPRGDLLRSTQFADA